MPTFELPHPPGQEPAILVVDDLPQNQIALEATLEPLGVRVVRANSGDEALRRLLDEDFALIFLDVQMPGMDGLETAAMIRQRARSAHVPIIFITAIHRDEAYAARGYSRGAVDYLMKPVDPEVVRVKASVFVDLYRQSIEFQDQSRKLAFSEAQAAFAMAAQEVRAPLNAARIQALLALHQLGDADLKVGKQLRLIARQIERLVRMLDEGFDLSRLQSGTVALVRTEFDLVLLAREVVERLRLTSGYHPLKVTGEEALIINGDRERLSHVLTHLVSNSIRFSPMGGEIEVSIAVEDEEDAHVTVRDHGLGIAPPRLRALFQKPQHPARSPAFAGMGVGLSIAQEVVESHNGTIWAESAGLPGAGTAIHFELPLEPEDAPLLT